MGKNVDLTLSEYTVIHQHFPAFLPACSQPPSSSLFPFAPKKLGHQIEGAGASGRTVKFKERPQFVKVFLCHEWRGTIFAEGILFSRVKCYTCFFSFLSPSPTLFYLFFVQFISEKLCVNRRKGSLCDHKENVMGIIHGDVFISRSNQLKIPL